MSVEIKAMYTITEVANMLGFHRDVVRRMMRNGSLKTVKIGKKHYVATSSLRAMPEVWAGISARAGHIVDGAVSSGERKPPSRVYFVQQAGEGPIKIGVTTDLGSRMRGLQSSNPYALTLLADVEGTEEDEHRLHVQFASARLHGEWFRPTPDLMATVASLIQSG